jgi:hypothetical protein
VRRDNPYITIEAASPLDSRWTPLLWFAWSRLLGTCRLKRACTAETWPAAVLTVRTHELASILGVYPNKVRSTVDQLKIVASISARSRRDHGGDLWVISVDNYAKYQKLGRPTSAETSAELLGPPYDPTTLRTEEEKNPPTPQEVEPSEKTPETTVDAAWPAVQEAFASYGVQPPRKLNTPRRTALRATLAEGSDPSTLVHGYMAFHDRHGADYDPLGYFTPETIFRAAHRAKYAEAYDRALVERGPPPWLPRGRQGVSAQANADAARDVTTEAASLLTAIRAGRQGGSAADDRVLPADVRRLRAAGDG